MRFISTDIIMILKVIGVCVIVIATSAAGSRAECITTSGNAFCVETQSSKDVKIFSTVSKRAASADDNANLFTSPLITTEPSTLNNLFTSPPVSMESNSNIPDAVPLLSNRDTTENSLPQNESIANSVLQIFGSPTSTESSTTTISDSIPEKSNEVSSVVSPASAVSDSIFYPVTVPVLPSRSSAKITEEPVSAMPTGLTIPINKLLPDRYTCGFQNESDRFPKFHIASMDEFPWTVLLRYNYELGCDAGFRCMGTLISDRYVLTAAHCVLTKQHSIHLDSVRLGEWMISSETDCDYFGKECTDKVVDVKIEKQLIHPNYTARYRNNDIALLRLEKSVNFTTFIRPICLPVENLEEPEVGTTLITSGWGTTYYGPQLDVKSKLYVPIIHKSHCQGFPFSFTKFFQEQGCFGISKSRDFCKADEGGPLMAVDHNDKRQWYLEGVISKGYGCNKGGLPGIYSRVTNYVKWIIQALAHDYI